jgi:hypothetical protein
MPHNDEYQPQMDFSMGLDLQRSSENHIPSKNTRSRKRNLEENPTPSRKKRRLNGPIASDNGAYIIPRSQWQGTVAPSGARFSKRIAEQRERKKLYERSKLRMDCNDGTF